MILQAKLVHIFDLDDTLINTKQAYFSSYLDLITKAAKIGETQALKILKGILPIYGSYNYQQIFPAFFKLLGYNYAKADIDKLSLNFEKLFWQRLALNKNALDYLKYLLKKQKKIALATNGQSAVQSLKLKRLGIGDFFEQHLCMISSEQRAAKPCPDMLNKILNNLGLTAKEAVFYGNNLSDMLAAKNASLDFVLYTGSLYQDDQADELDLGFSISSWDKLLAGI